MLLIYNSDNYQYSAFNAIIVEEIFEDLFKYMIHDVIYDKSINGKENIKMKSPKER